MTMDETKYMQTLAWATAVLTTKMMLLHLGAVRVRVSISHSTLYIHICHLLFMHISHAHSHYPLSKQYIVCALIERQVWKL